MSNWQPPPTPSAPVLPYATPESLARDSGRERELYRLDAALASDAKDASLQVAIVAALILGGTTAFLFCGSALSKADVAEGFRQAMPALASIAISTASVIAVALIAMHWRANVQRPALTLRLTTDHTVVERGGLPWRKFRRTDLTHLDARGVSIRAREGTAIAEIACETPVSSFQATIRLSADRISRVDRVFQDWLRGSDALTEADPG